MHPTREELRQFADQNLADTGRQNEIADHVEACEFCSEFCQDYLSLTEDLASPPDKPLPEKLRQLADNLFDDALRSTIIDLKPLTTGTAETPASYLAADGEPHRRSGVHSVATFCSENPEVVLRVMRDPQKGNDYLQLLAEDSRLAAHVMVQVPELGKEIITDAEGRAAVDLEPTENLEQLKWQLKMPEAVFSLEPLQYDPEKVEYAEEVVLETDRHDRVEVRFEGKTEGKLLAIRVVALDGRADFGSARISVSQENKSRLLTVAPGQAVEFGPIDSDTTINIRLYQ